MVTPPGAPGVLARVDRLYGDVLALLPPGAEADAAQRDRASLHEPLRLAVVGRVSSGKSTLVNALVGRRIAPTSAGECTRVVTWYRHGPVDRADVRLKDGTIRPVRLVGGALPDRLDVPATAVDRLVVQLASGPLRDLTLIDTPGLDTATAPLGEATRRAVLGEDASGRAAGEADALLHLIGDAARRSDVDFLADFQASSGTLSATAVNAVGVVAQADRFGSGPFDPRDPFDLARGVAQGLARDHRAELAAVVAVSGLLAETALTGRISEGLAARLAGLADLDPITLSLRRQDPDLQDLFAVFGPWAVGAGREAARQRAAALKAWCVATSGIEDLQDVVRRRLVPRADLIKGHRALGELRASARRLPAAVRDDALALVEAAELDPALHPLAELRALHDLAAQIPDSPLVADLAAFVDAGAPPHEDAEDVVRWARSRSADATRAAALALTPAEAAAGRVLARSYQLLARRAAAR